MPSLVSLRAAWPALAALASAAMLAAAHAFEAFGYAPCTLCLRQREVYWVALAVAGIGLGLERLKRPLPRRLLALLLAAIFFAGMLVAGFHAGVEWKWWPGPTTCTGRGGAISAEDLSGLLAGAKVRPPACDEAAWRLFGLSMAGYNTLISAALASLGLVAAFSRSKR